MWKFVSAVISELASYEQLFLSIEQPMPLKISVSSPSLATRPFALDGETWLLAANAESDKTLSAKVELPENIRVTGVKLGKCTPKITGRSMSFELAPLECVFIRLK